ncbi:MAG: hypothetical protein ACJ8FY_22715 [Gemmataceae bacterium]
MAICRGPPEVNNRAQLAAGGLGKSRKGDWEILQAALRGHEGRVQNAIINELAGILPTGELPAGILRKQRRTPGSEATQQRDMALFTSL